MFWKKERELTALDLALDRAFRALTDYPVDSAEYNKILERVVRLHAMKAIEKPSSVSKDTLAAVGANLLGILMIIKHERVNVITSKAMSFVARTRI